jgi:hypothetical protein
MKQIILIALVASFFIQYQAAQAQTDSVRFTGIGNRNPGTWLDIGTAADSILTGGARLANVGRLAARYSSLLNTGFVVGTESYANQLVPTSGSIQALEGFAHISHNEGLVSLAIGTIGNAELLGNGKLSNLRGMQGNFSIRGGGQIDNGASFFGSPSGRVGNGTGTCVNGYGLYIGRFGEGIINKYGVYIEDSNASNYFAGNIRSGGIIFCNGISVGRASLQIKGVITQKGITGGQTINAATGTVNFAAGQYTITVGNVLVNENSIVFAVIRTGDKTAVIRNVIPANGSFTINLVNKTTGETSVGFFVLEPGP